MTTKSVANALDSQLDNLRNGVKHLVDAGSERAGDLKDIGMTQIDNLGKLVKKHPFAAIAIAFGVGYIAMRIVRR
jgi:ElaB/YqjD/DUF883 family membrane-anchored ribosome-binding protein